MSYSYFNYREIHFERSNPTHIHGEPTFDTLNNICNKIKANYRSVYSHIGGGAHVHLSLVLTATQYSLIVPAIHGHPPLIGLLIIPYHNTIYMSTTMCDTHVEAFFLP